MNTPNSKERMRHTPEIEELLTAAKAMVLRHKGWDCGDGFERKLCDRLEAAIAKSSPAPEEGK